MPDLISVFARWWKTILGLTLLATVIALVIALLQPKEYLSVATALPANSVVADKARVFNSNIEALYSDFGTPDELDRMEGTAMLDTLFIASAKAFNLVSHYELGQSREGEYKAAMKLKKNSKIARSAYGELKVKVWDEDRNLAAALANHLMDGIQNLHQQLQSESNRAILERIKEDHSQRLQQYKSFADSASNASRAEADIASARRAVLLEQLQQYEKMIDQYSLAVRTNTPVLLTVERARPALWPDRPKTLVIVVLTVVVAMAASFLLALFLETRRQK